MNFAKYRKAIASLLGGITGGVVVTVLGAFGVVLAPPVAAAVALILAAVGTAISAPNAEA